MWLVAIQTDYFWLNVGCEENLSKKYGSEIITSCVCVYVCLFVLNVQMNNRYSARGAVESGRVVYFILSIVVSSLAVESLLNGCVLMCMPREVINFIFMCINWTRSYIYIYDNCFFFVVVNAIVVVVIIIFIDSVLVLYTQTLNSLKKKKNYIPRRDYLSVNVHGHGW